MTVRRVAVAVCCVAVLGLTAGACAESDDDSGAVTNLDEVGPQIAKLRLEVQQLRQEVRTLREEVAVLTPPTDPETGLPLVDDTTSTSLPLE